MQIKNQISLTRKTLYVIMVLGLFFSAFSAENLPTAHAQEIAAGKQTDALISLSADQASFGASEDIILHVTISNPNSYSISILKWYVPAEGISAPLFTILLNGEPVKYIGPLATRPVPTEQDYITLQPGETLTRNVNFSSDYDFSISGNYTVVYDATSEELYADLSNGFIKKAGHLTSNQMDFFIESRPIPVSKEIMPLSVSGSTSFSSCNASQQSVLVNARSIASTRALDALTYLNAGITGRRYVTWFGVYDPTRYSTVRGVYSAISSAMDTAGINFDCSNSGDFCSQGYAGWVWTNQPYNIYLCSNAFSYADFLPGLIIHEMSHFIVVADTDDYVYGWYESQDLASSNPNNAIRNADNYEFFAEDKDPDFYISGNDGVGGATITYTGGFTTADGSGNYSFAVPPDWSGTVTPSKSGYTYTFTPVSRSYTNVLADKTAQNYTALNTGMPYGWVGGAVITTDKNIVAVGRPHIGSEVASYSGFSAGALTAYVPMLFKNAYSGDYDSALYVQNVDASVTANVSIKYYDSATGALTCTYTDTIKPLASKGYWLPTLSAAECTGGTGGGLPVGWVGSAVVTSSTTAKIVANGRPHIGGEMMTYDSVSSGSLTSYLPMLFNGAYGGGYNSAFYVQNVSPSATAAVTIKYYDSDTGALTCSDTAMILPNTSTGYWLPNAVCLYATSNTPALLPAGWVGGVVVTSSAAPIVTVGRPHVGSQITTYNGFAAGGLSSYVPMLFRKAYGGAYDSALYVQNVDPLIDAEITIKYYDSATGALTCTDTDTIAPLSSKGYWLPNLSAAECTGGGLPDDWVGGVVVTSTSANIVAIGRAHIGAQVTTYNGFASGNSNSYLPMLFKNMWGTYDSAFYVQNTDAAGPASVTVKFYDTDGNLSCVRHDNIPALSTLGYWVPSVTCE